MWPDRLYITELGLAAYAVIYVPLALALAWFAYKRYIARIPSAPLRRGSVVVLMAALLSAPLWDVFAISMDAARICGEQGGLRVYRTVEADGFLGSFAIEYWAKLGYSYVEYGRSRYTYEGGAVVRRPVTEFVSRYQARTAEDHKVVGRHFARSKEVVVDRHTGEILGSLTYFSVYPGRFDGLLLGSLGSGPVVWLCGAEPPPGRRDRLDLSDVIIATIKPSQTNQESTK